MTGQNGPAELCCACWAGPRWAAHGSVMAGNDRWSTYTLAHLLELGLQSLSSQNESIFKLYLSCSWHTLLLGLTLAIDESRRPAQPAQREQATSQFQAQIPLQQEIKPRRHGDTMKVLSTRLSTKPASKPAKKLATQPVSKLPPITTLSTSPGLS